MEADRDMGDLKRGGGRGDAPHRFIGALCQGHWEAVSWQSRLCGGCGDKLYVTSEGRQIAIGE